jgi:ribA/ribD-fused uncharacterized protein
MPQNDPLYRAMINNNIDPQTNLQSTDDPLKRAMKISPYLVSEEQVPVGRFGVGDSKYDRDIHLGDIEDLERIRGKEQPGLVQFGNFLSQAVIGEIIGGTIEGVGYLVDINDAFKVAQGEEVEFGNFLTEAGKDLRSWSQETSPIYKTYNEGEFAPGHWSWWMNNAPSVASTLSLLIPAAGTVKGLSMLGKATGLGIDAAKIARGLGASKEVAAITKQISTGVSQAVLSRHMENLMEANGKYEEIYNRDLEAGRSEQEAKQNASIAASDIYNKNWIMLAQDIPSYILLGRAFGKTTKATTRGIAGYLGQGTLIPTAKKSLSVLQDMVGEGFEEGYQYSVSEYADELSKQRIDPNYKIQGLKDIMKEGDFWTSVTFGALGSSVFQTAGRAINEKILGKPSEEKLRLNNVKSWAPTLKHYSAAIQGAEKIGDTKTVESLKTQLAIKLGVKEAELGNTGHLNEFLNQILDKNNSSETLERYGLDEEDIENVKQMFPNIQEHVNESAKTYEFYIKQGFTPQIASAYADATTSSLLLRNRLTEINSAKEEALSKLNEFGRYTSDEKHSLSETGRNIFDTEAQISALKERAKYLTHLSKQPISEGLQEKYTERKKLVTEQIEALNKLKNETSSSKEYNSKEKSKDIGIINSLKKKESYYNDYVKTLTETDDVYDALESKEDLIDFLIEEQGKINRGEKKTPKEPKVPVNEEELAPRIEELASRIAKGDMNLSPEDILFKEDYSSRIEQAVKEIKDKQKTTDKVEDLKTKKLSQVLKNNGDRIKISDSNGEVGYLLREDNNYYLVDYTNTNDRNKLDSKFAEATFSLLESQVGFKIEGIVQTAFDPDPVDVKELDENDTIEISEYAASGTIKGSDKGYEGKVELDFMPKYEDTLGLWLSDQNNTLKDKKITFLIKKDEYPNFWEQNPRISGLVDKGDFKSLTIKEIANIPIHAKIEGVEGYLFIPDSNVGIDLTEAKESGMKLIPIPTSIKVIEDEEEREKAEKTYVESYIANQNLFRKNILRGLLKGEEVTYEGLSKGAGLFNNIKDFVGNIRDAFGLRSYNEVELAIGLGVDRGREIRGKNKEAVGVHKGFGGGVYLITNKTANKKKTVVKLNPSKINEIDAKVIYNALANSLKEGQGFNSPYEGTGVSGSLAVDGRVISNGEVLRLLVSHGLHTKNAAITRSELASKRLYVSDGVINYGDNFEDIREGETIGRPFKLNPKTASDRDITHFKEWLQKNVNYGVSLNRLGEKYKHPFTVGTLEYTEQDINKLTYDGLIVRSNFVTTDIQARETGSLVKKVGVRVDLHKEPIVKKKTTKKEEVKKPVVELKESDILVSEEDTARFMKEAMEAADEVNPSAKPFNRFKISDSYIKQDLEKEKEYLRKMISAPIHVLDKIVEVANETGSKEAFAQVLNASIYIYKKAEEGTLFHEAFHVVNLYYLNERRRQSIYSNAKKVYPQLKNADDRTIEEFLAEEFRKFILTEKEVKPKGTLLQRFFDMLHEFISWINDKVFGQLSVEKIFHDIKKGEYKESKINKESFKKFKNNSYTKLKDEFNSDTIKSVTNLILYKLVLSNKLYNAKSFKKLDFELVKNAIAIDRDKFLEKLKEKGENPIIRGWVDLYNRVLDPNIFNEFRYHVDGKLLSMGIQSRDEVDFDEVTGEELARHDKSSYEINSRDNALTDVKLFFATLPNTGMKDPITGSFQLIDFGEAWSRILKDTFTATDTYEIEKRLKAKAKKSQFYTEFLYGTKDEDGNIVRQGFLNSPEDFRTRVYRTLMKHRHDFINMRAKGGKFEIFSGGISTASEELGMAWSTQFAHLEETFNNEGSPNKTYLNKIINTYQKKITEPFTIQYTSDEGITDTSYNDYLLKISNLFNSIGIEFSPKLVNDVAFYLSPEEPNLGLKKLINDYLTRIFGNGETAIINKIAKGEFEENNKLYVETYLLQESKFKELANIVVEVDDDYQVDMILGPDNAMYYLYAQPSYLTDFNKRLWENNGAELDRLSNVVYNENSLYLKAMRDGEGKSRIGIKTMSSYRQGLRVKGYTKLTDREDFLLKFHSTHLGYIPLPTLSDKKPFHFFTGMEVIKMNGIKKDDRGRVIIPDHILEILDGYRLDEENRIKYAKKEIELAKKSGNYNNLVKNYHFQTIDENGVPDLSKGDGNALKYHIFTYLNEEGAKHSRNQLQVTFKRNVIKTIETANKLGIITFNRDAEGKIKFDSIKNAKYGLDKDLIDKYKDKEKGYNVNESDAIYMLMTEFTLNSQIAGIETSKLLTGDPAFYKLNNVTGETIEDINKRIGVLVSPGDRIRNDYLDGEFAGITKFNVATIQDVIENIQKHNPSLYKFLHDSFKAQGLSEKEIKERLSGYNKTNGTDAQVIITPRFHRSLSIRLGEWTDEDQVAYDLLMSEYIKDPYSSIYEGEKRIFTDEEKKIINKLIMQPLKTLYFGMEFEDRLGIPTYDKMSMATIWPSMVKGTQIEKLYEKMMDEENPIDMLKFSSAVKVGERLSVQVLDENQNAKEDNINYLSSITNQQDFKNLRLQQVTDPHGSYERMLATQVRKIVMANLQSVIGEDGKVKKIYKVGNKTYTGKELQRQLNDSYSELSLRGFQDLKDNLGLTEDGSLNLDKFYDVLVSSAENAQMPQQVIDALINHVNIDTLPDRKWIESRIISLVGKYVVDIQLPGDLYIQQSNFGLHNKLDDKLQLVDEKGRMEIMVSPALFKDIIPNYDTLSYEEKRSWLKSLENEQLEGMAYRIPTGGPNMVGIFVVKDFLPDQTGNTIIFPSEITTLWGTDFDIDKAFIVRYNYFTDSAGRIQKHEYFEGDKNGKITSLQDLEKIWQQRYAADFRLKEALEALDPKGLLSKSLDDDLTTTEQSLLIKKLHEAEELLQDFDINNVKPYQIKNLIEKLKKIPDNEEFAELYKGHTALRVNSKVAIQNRTLDLMKCPLLTSEHIVDTKTPLDAHTASMKAIVKEIRELTGKNNPLSALEAYSPTYQLMVKKWFNDGKNGIGPFALNNVHHILAQLVGLGIKTEYNNFANVRDGIVSLSEIKDKDQKKNISDWFSGLISAHVDIAKDPWIFDLNVNKQTYNIVSYLLRAGVGEKTFWYLLQPSVDQYLKLNDREKSKLINSYDSKVSKLGALLNIKSDQIKADIAKYSNPETIFAYSLKEFKDLIKFKEITLDAKSIEEDKRNNYDYNLKQLGLLNAFKQLGDDANKLSATVLSSRIDSKGYGSSMSEVIQFNEQLNKLQKKSGINNFNNLINDTFLGTLKDKALNTILTSFDQLTITSTKPYMTMYKELLSMIPTTDDKDIDIKNRSNLGAIMFSSIVAEYFNSTSGFNIDREELKRLFVGKKTSVGARFNKILKKYPELKNNMFLRHIKTLYNRPENIFYIKGINGDTNDKGKRDSIAEDWQRLLMSENDEIRELAEDLILVSFYNSGFKRNLYSFYNNIPIPFLKEKSNRALPAKSKSLDEYLVQFKDSLNSLSLPQEFLDKIKKDIIYNNPDFFDVRIDKVKYHTRKLEGSKNKADIYFIKSMEKDEFSKVNGAPRFISMEDSGEIIYLEYIGKTEKESIYRYIPRRGTTFKGIRILELGYNEPSFIHEDSVYTTEKIIKTMEKNFSDFIAYSILDIQEDSENQEEPEVQTEQEPSESINIYSTEKNGYQNLSNILNGPVKDTINGKELVFKTVEHLFQIYKALFAKDTKTANEIFNAETGWDAQRLSKTIMGLNSKEWDKVSSAQLEKAMRLSFEQNETARNLLLSTGNTILTHHTDKFNMGKWEKVFPEILMKIRSNLQDKNETPFLSEEQIELVKLIPTSLSFSQQYDKLKNAINNNMNIKEFKELIESIKNCE